MRLRVILVFTALSATPALAADDTFEVRATVIASCAVSAQDLDFGDYDPVAATPLDETTTISVTCTNGSDYDLLLDAGAGTGASIASRRMEDGSANQLAYSLYRDALRTQVWGETIDTDTMPGTGSGAAQDVTIYGRVPAQQTAPAGDYEDIVTVTVNY